MVARVLVLGTQIMMFTSTPNHQRHRHPHSYYSMWKRPRMTCWFWVAVVAVAAPVVGVGIHNFPSSAPMSYPKSRYDSTWPRRRVGNSYRTTTTTLVQRPVPWYPTGWRDCAAAVVDVVAAADVRDHHQTNQMREPVAMERRMVAPVAVLVLDATRALRRRHVPKTTLPVVTMRYDFVMDDGNLHRRRRHHLLLRLQSE